METEYEATFARVDKNKVRALLKSLRAKLIRKEYSQRRVVFNLPHGHEIKGGWLRVRDEGNKITMSLKIVAGDKIENQHEICLVIDDFEKAVELLEKIGCERKAFQENRRELWQMDGVEVTIDEWPFLEPFVEIEGKSEEAVKKVSKKLGFDYKKAIFDSVDYLYAEKYGLTKDQINNQTPEILFKMKNPFVK